MTIVERDRCAIGMRQKRRALSRRNKYWVEVAFNCRYFIAECIAGAFGFGAIL